MRLLLDENSLLCHNDQSNTERSRLGAVTDRPDGPFGGRYRTSFYYCEKICIGRRGSQNRATTLPKRHRLKYHHPYPLFHCTGIFIHMGVYVCVCCRETLVTLFQYSSRCMCL